MKMRNPLRPKADGSEEAAEPMDSPSEDRAEISMNRRTGRPSPIRAGGTIPKSLGNTSSRLNPSGPFSVGNSRGRDFPGGSSHDGVPAGKRKGGIGDIGRAGKNQ